MTERQHFDFTMMFLRDKFAVPEGWTLSLWELKNHGTKHEYISFSGAVCPPLKSGKRKGRPNWAKRDKDTELTLAATHDEIEAFKAAWRAETGLCYNCHGNGQEWFGWSATEGNRYRPCKHCNETGKFQPVEVAA